MCEAINQKSSTEGCLPFFQINVWKMKLNDDLPLPLHQIEAWLHEVEELIDEDLPAFQDYSEAMALIQEKITLFKVGKEKEIWKKSSLCWELFLRKTFS